jgi:hypothetical protein
MNLVRPTHLSADGSPERCVCFAAATSAVGVVSDVDRAIGLAWRMADVAVPLITAGGTVVAAILTGFGAAALKHRWDGQAERQRWDRERLERRRDELRLAFMQYFDADRRICQMGYDVWRDRWSDRAANGSAEAGERRKLVEQLERLQGVSGLEPSQFSAMVNGAVAADFPVVLLGWAAAEPFTSHVQGLDDWVMEMAARGEQGQDTVKPPDARPLVQLANSLLRSDGT